jgi:hypothetical protein
MKKRIFNHWLSYVFPLAVSVILGLAIFFDDGNTIPVSINIGIVIITAILSYGSVEWVVFKTEFNDRIKLNAEIGLILNEFNEANVLSENLINVFRNDLAFDRNIKINNAHKPFHLFLSELKYKYYLSSYFKYVSDLNSPAIKGIPRHFFEKYEQSNGEKYSVWMWLIERSNSYRSIQVLNNETSQIYLDNEERQTIETNYLKTQYECKSANLNSIKKLFVIKDEWLSTDGKSINEPNVEKYLAVWKNQLSGMSKTSRKKLQIKFIRISEAKGATNNQEHVDDIGIFDSILGVQSPIETGEYLINDNTDISFYFDKKMVDNKKATFETIFQKANSLI